MPLDARQHRHVCWTGLNSGRWANRAKSTSIGACCTIDSSSSKLTGNVVAATRTTTCKTVTEKVAVRANLTGLSTAKYATCITAGSGAVPTAQELTLEVGQVEGCGTVTNAISCTNFSKQVRVQCPTHRTSVGNEPAHRSRVHRKVLDGTDRSVAHAGDPLQSSRTSSIDLEVLSIETQR